jgi:hypothetical protein
MNNAKLLEVMKILEKYVDPEDCNFHCEHDEFFMCVDVEDINYDDMTRLLELGCHENEGGLKAFVSC